MSASNSSNNDTQDEWIGDSVLPTYLENNIQGFKKLNSVEKFDTGQSNPTYLLHTESGKYVLRRKPTGKLLKSAHAIDREYRVMKALENTPVPVPTTLHLCEDLTIIGSDFYIMSYVNGQTFWSATLPELDSKARTQCYDQMNQTLAAIHSVDVEQAGLTTFGKPGSYYERQFSRWTRQYRDSQTEDIPEMERVIPWLENNMVEDDGRVSLVHGDYRLDNLMFNQTGNTVIAVIDWELSTLGHPWSDLAYQCSLWRMEPDSGLSGLRGVNRKALGIPSEEAYVEDYCQRMGLDGIAHWNFYLIFSLFRMAAIVQGVKKRALDGNASNAKAMEVGALAQPLAKEASRILEIT